MQLKVVTFRDVVPVDVDPGCSTDGTFQASCNVPITTTLVRAELEDLSDGLQPSSSLTSMGFSAQGDGEGDRLVGSNLLRDVLDGGLGNDALLGNGGNDSLEGGPGEDTINAGPGNDYVDAGIHDDRVVGGTGIDTMFGYYGDDTINADDNAGGDQINCGPGYDLAIFNCGRHRQQQLRAAATPVAVGPPPTLSPARAGRGGTPAPRRASSRRTSSWRGPSS